MRTLPHTSGTTPPQLNHHILPVHQPSSIRVLRHPWQIKQRQYSVGFACILRTIYIPYHINPDKKSDLFCSYRDGRRELWPDEKLCPQRKLATSSHGTHSIPLSHQTPGSLSYPPLLSWGTPIYNSYTPNFSFTAFTTSHPSSHQIHICPALHPYPPPHLLL